MAVHLFWTHLLASFKSFHFLFHSNIFNFNHSDFMKDYCKVFSAMKSNKLCDNLFKWASSGISPAKVNFTPFSYTRHHHFYPPDHKWTTTVLCAVPTSFHRNHPGFSGSFQAAVILFCYPIYSRAYALAEKSKSAHAAQQCESHSNLGGTRCQKNQGCKRPNRKDHLEDSLVCSEGAEVLC